MADPILYVDAPARRPRRGGIRSVAPFVPAERLAATQTVQHVSEGCGLPQDDWKLCYDIEAGADEKTFDGVDTTVSPVANFVAYSGVRCFLNSEDDFAARAAALLEAGEDRIVERKIGDYLLAQAAAGTATDVVAAIAAAENLLDTTYPGLGLILISRAGAVHAAAADVIEGDKEGNLWTINGTPVLASGEISSDYVFATGAITVLASQVTNMTVPDWKTNGQAAVAERAYGVAFDCDIAAAFPVDYTLGGGGDMPGPAGASAYEIAVQNGFTGTEQEWLESLVGPPGDDGAAATVAVGTVTTDAPGSSASVTNGGTATAAVLNFSIPRGDEGEPGDPGDPGDPGAPGVVQSIVQGDGVTIDATDPANPVVSVP